MALDRDDLLEALQSDQVQAFLRVIREGETNQSEDAYRMVNGGGFFDAPPWRHPYEGLSTTQGGKAAGAPQYLPSTWAGLVRQYAFEDFSPINQDCGAVALIKERGALDDVMEGRLDEAIRKLSAIWISLPGLGARAQKIFGRYGGRLAGDLSPDRTGDPAPSDSQPEPIPQSKEVKPMLPFIGALISAAISAAPDLIRLIGGGERSQKNAAVMDKVAEVALQVTGAVNEQQAAERLQDAATAEKFREAVRDNFDQWLAMTVKFREMDEASITKAREFATVNRFPIILGMTFIEVLSLLFVAISSIGGGYVLYGDFPPEIKGAVITLMLIGGFTGVKEFWFGSSRGSMVKDSK